ncbi:MAG: L-2-amino-thiazoline-4-carboxylic acid hydrolase [Bacilli bacterium]
MKIKQQKIIKNFLFSELDTEVAQKIFDEQNNILDKFILNAFNKTKNQLKTLKNTILPRIALYKALNNYGFSMEDSNNHMKNYMLNYIAKSKHNSMVKMEKVPGFYSLYSKIFLKIMRKTDLQQSKQKHDAKSFDVTITKCLWHQACVENECPELCRLFCDVDNITYGELNKIGFTRTQTLGYGGDCCDFHFLKK